MMFKNKQILLSLVGILVVSVIAGTAFVLSGSGQTSNNKQSVKVLRSKDKKQSQNNPTEKEIDDAATPIVDYNTDNLSNDPIERKLREEKNARYNGYLMIVSNPGRNVTHSEMEGAELDSDLPFADSDAVIEGKIRSSEAYLSADKRAVYSEYTIDVKDILKNTDDNKIRKNEPLVIDRLGGRVRYPSGQIIRYKVTGQGSPLIEGKYLLFLKKVDGDYRILTGYEMKGSKVFALDGARINFRGIGKSAFDKHNNKDLDKFREEVEKAKNQPSSNKTIKGEG